MRREFRALSGIAVAAILLLAQSVSTAQVQDRGQAALKAAMDREVIDGDLKGAIEQYKKIAEARDRALAAQALVRMADAYRKLGDNESQKIYERIVREFGDQKEAVATARARLGNAVRPAKDIGLHKVFDGDFLVAVSPDGRYLIHHNGLAQNAVVLRDLSTGVERTLDSGFFMDEAKFSKDGAQVAYGSCNDSGLDVCEVRVANVAAAGKTVPRRLYASRDGHVGPIDWSPDGKLIVVAVQRRAERLLQLGLLRVSEGTLQVLQSVAWGGTFRGFFSPDGRDIALALRMEDDAGVRDIVLMDVAEKRQTALVTGPSDDFPLGWAPDGAHLLFASDRNGAVGVWAQAVKNRRPFGAPTLVQANIGGDVRPVGITRSGGLHVGVRTFSQDVELAPIDLGAGKEDSSPVQIRSAADRTWLPAWSPDGQSLAYVLVRNGAEKTVGIRTTRTGVERELYLGSALGRVRSLSWAPDGRSLVGWGRDLKGRYGIFRIDANDGHVTPIVFRDPPLVGNFFWSSDGKKMYYVSQGTLFEHDGDVERALMRNGPIGQLSPDLRWAARLDTNGPTGALVIHPITGGEPRELLRFDEPEQFNLASPRWTPDGRAVMVMKRRGADEREVLLVPIDGTAPRALDFDLNRIAKDFPWFVLSPDGRKAAYIVGDDRLEVWVIENFLSALK